MKAIILEDLYDTLENHDDCPAEVMLDAAAFVHKTVGIITPEVIGHGITMGGVDRIAVSIRLADRPSVAFRAIMEGWDLDRIVRELS